MIKKLIPVLQEPFDEALKKAHVPPDSDFAETLFVLYLVLLLCHCSKIAFREYSK